MPSATILIADDHTLFREGIRSICENLGKFRVLGEAKNGSQAVEMTKALEPDLVLMDINMPILDGEITLPANMAVKVLDEFKILANGEGERTEMLTQSEMAVLKLVASGIDNKKIATTLNISEKTVSNRMSEIFSKLQVNNRTQAALLAIRRGWASLYPEEAS